MTEDRSLDEFAGSDTAESDGTDGEAVDGTVDSAAVDGDDASSAGDEIAGVEETRPTSTWTTTGADCERCGETGTRRWRDGDSLVCIDCKEW